MGLWPISTNLFGMFVWNVFLQNPHEIVIPSSRLAEAS